MGTVRGERERIPTSKMHKMKKKPVILQNVWGNSGAITPPPFAAVANPISEKIPDIYEYVHIRI